MRVYLDNNATTPLHPDVIKAITDFLPYYGNPSSLHETGRDAKEKLYSSINSISEFFGCPREDMIITSCASESNNIILKSFMNKKYDFRPHIIISAIEHPAILETAKYLESNGFDLSLAPVNEDGVVEIETIKNLIKKETVLISVMWVNNEIGTVQPVEEIGRLAKEKNIFFHVDAVQAAGSIPISFKDLPFDSASISAHKMYAPKGIGLLYVKNFAKRKKELTPLIHGGHQEGGFRAGTENTIGIAAFGAACSALSKEMEKNHAQEEKIRDHFEDRVQKEIPHIIINGKNSKRKVSTSNITFKYIEGESILLRLDLHGISVSTGSACSTGSLDPSHVIMALSDDKERAHGSIRFSFGRENTMADADYTVDKLKETVAFLRSISPLYKGE
ncbi:MAG TPA: cysteine desulfurase family protein [Spirochaetota bacterium]|nr:cysteine desulfurase family protein [Spirochaetota bacterium]HOR44077.1 cysteine desulfurase family protein [Spirochaetota bacterium]HOU84481.1 cysteine desulfurase family protein [Spirochaetota bacterium]HPK56207.1 cysteine desulfurase family protein [Spirochaetota bacterium]HQE58650.1 cysteine desulfurase family protein [Spirochaetota bacterium]